MLSTELLVKGVFLGLVLHAARVFGLADHPCWKELGLLCACAAGGVVGGSLASWWRSRSGANAGARLVLGWLEHGWLAQAGLIIGLALGIFFAVQPLGGEDAGGWLVGLTGAGALLGVIFKMVELVPNRNARLGIGAVLGLLVVAGMGLCLGLWGAEGMARARLPGSVPAGIWLLAAFLLHGYLILTSLEPESEGELGCLTTALPGLGLYLASGTAGWGLGLGLLLPTLFYFVLGEGVAPRIRLAKLLTRARLNLAGGNWRKALGCSSRALSIDPGNPRALNDFWRLTAKLDTDELLGDPNAKSLVRAEKCLDWVARRLGSNPGPVGLEECGRMLMLVEKLDPPLIPLVDYWRVVSSLHGGQLENAMARLRGLLEDPDSEAPFKAQAKGMAWLLGLAWHEGLRKGVVEPLLNDNPEAVLEALAAVEAALAEDSENLRLRAAWRTLVENLSEARHGILVQKRPWKIDWRRVEGIGVGMLEEPSRLDRGAELVRLAALGNPGTSPGSLIAVARALQNNGRDQEALDHFSKAVEAGQRQGPANLSADDRELYYRAVRFLAETAEFKENLPEACRLWQLYADNDRSGLETLRKLADLHERLGEPGQALKAVEKGLIYNSSDKDLLARRERYLWSLPLDRVEANPEAFKGILDANFCVEKARKALDSAQSDEEWLRFAEHLLRLALLAKPDQLPARQLLGRALSRLGDREGAVAEWENVRSNKPANWVEGESDEAWQRANQALGDAYLEMGKYTEAIQCLEDFRKSSKSGANTLYKLGLAHEGLGEFRQARRLFREVEGFEGNPLVWQAREALERIRQAEAGPPG